MKSLKIISFCFFLLFTAKGISRNLDTLINSKIAIDSLIKRISDLEQASKDQKEAQRLAATQATQSIQTQFKNALQALQTGLENGSEIELIVPGTLRLLAIKDLNETLSSINNPTSKSLGKPFSEMVIESASNHLLPKFSDPETAQNAKSKFKSILEAIYKGPIVQGLINSNPISSTINAAIQQAGFFEKPRTTNLILTKDQIKGVTRQTPIDIPIKTANLDGTAFTQTEMQQFNKDLEKRIEFYGTLNEYGMSQNEITQQLYVEAKLIKKAVKSGKTEICKLLAIEPTNALNGLNEKFGNLTTDQMRVLLNETNFKKAIALSDYAKDQLPDVKEFNNTVVSALLKYIDGYIKILNDYKDISATNLDPVEITKQIIKLNIIKNNLNTPLQ